MATRNDLLEKANRLFDDKNTTCEDDIKIFFYKVACSAIPEITDDKTVKINLLKLSEVFIDEVSPIYANAIEMYYLPEKPPTLDIIADTLGYNRASTKNVIEIGLAYISNKKDEYLIKNI